MQTSQGKDTGCTAAPGPNTAPISVGFWASRSLARSPDRPGLHRASLAFGAAARLRLLPHTASRRQAGLSRDAPTCVQLPSACGCFQLAPQRTCTSNPGSMPGTPRTSPPGGPQTGPSLTAAARDDRTIVQAGMEEWPRRVPNKRMAPNRRAKCPQTRYPDSKSPTLHKTGASPPRTSRCSFLGPNGLGRELHPERWKRVWPATWDPYDTTSLVGAASLVR